MIYRGNQHKWYGTFFICSKLFYCQKTTGLGRLIKACLNSSTLFCFLWIRKLLQTKYQIVLIMDTESKFWDIHGWVSWRRYAFNFFMLQEPFCFQIKWQLFKKETNKWSQCDHQSSASTSCPSHINNSTVFTIELDDFHFFKSFRWAFYWYTFQRT